MPLFANVQNARFQDGIAQLGLRLNGVDATCRNAELTVSEETRTLSSTRFFCNWLGVGNVLAIVQLTADWQDPEANSFGGRYRLQFNGTGNAAGTGTFKALVQRAGIGPDQATE